MSPPAAISGLERLLLVLAGLSAALVFLPLAAETALLHWNIIGAEHEFVAQLRRLGFWSCLACMAASWFLEKEKEEGGHQAIIFGLLAAILLAAAWAIETLVLLSHKAAIFRTAKFCEQIYEGDSRIGTGWWIWIAWLWRRVARVLPLLSGV